MFSVLLKFIFAKIEGYIVPLESFGEEFTGTALNFDYEVTF